MSLALVMIVRDEARRLGRCLASARPFVDEMIVLDTGSVDGTAAVAAEAGARVEQWVWRQDFAAARNAALDLSDADWNLVLDADEWIIRADGLRDSNRLARTPFIGSLLIENQIETAAGVEIATAWVSRLLPRGVRYRGRIHEQPDSRLPRRRVDVTLGHDGYLPAERARKGDRNEILLRQAIAEAPNDGYLWHQLGREYDAGCRYDEAVEAFCEALRLSPVDAPWRHGLAVRAVHAMTQSRALNKALAAVQAEDDRYASSADWHFALGALFLECAGADPDNAVQRWLPAAEARWLRCLEIGDRSEHADAVRGRGGHMAAHNLAVLYGALGSETEARRYEALAAELRRAA